MSQESEPTIRLREIRIDLRRQFIQLETEDGAAIRYSLTPQSLRLQLMQGQRIEAVSAPGEAPDDQAEEGTGDQQQPVEQSASPPAREKQPTLRLSGKLQSQPVEGRLDRHQKPTAWARFLAHMDGQDGASLLLATFHGRCREIALGLNEGDPITGQGYYHPVKDPGSDRLSTFSIFHLISYPGKPPKAPKL